MESIKPQEQHSKPDYKSQMAYTMRSILTDRLGVPAPPKSNAGDAPQSDLELKKEDCKTPGDLQRWFLQRLVNSVSNPDYKALLTQEENVVRDLHQF